MKVLVINACILLLMTSCFKSESFRITKYNEENPKKINGPLANFLFGDMHGLTVNTLRTNAIPLKLALTAIILEKQEKDKSIKLDKNEIRKAFTSWGFFYSDSLPTGWDETEKIPLNSILPIGVDSGELLGFEGKERIEVMNFNCSSCHMGTGYDKVGRPNFKYIPGLPNTSLNLDNFMSDVFSSLLRYSNDKDFEKKVYSAMKVIFPDTETREITTLKVMHPIFKKTLNKFNDQFGAFLPTSFGGPGQSNAIGLFKSRYKVKKFTAKDSSEANFVSIPALYKKGLRTSLLVDGSTAPHNSEFFKEMSMADVTPEHIKNLANSAIYFPVLVTGASEKGAEEELSNLESFITYFTYLKPERFPGKIDFEKAEKGKSLYENKCMSCHGRYEGDLSNLDLVSFPNKLVSYKKIGTDPLRANGITEELVQNLEKSKIGKYFKAKRTEGYVAPMLSALWATAPYLHNGSIPTLWDLMHPELRPSVFKVGGHMLDYEKVGLSFPEGYVPWTKSVFYNTKDLGKKNTGHEFPFNKMSEEEKKNLLEFLKLL